MSDSSQTGFFISFEGSEGCGKSTQIRSLVEALEQAGREYVLVREPGGTPIGETIRHLLQHSDEGLEMTPEAELLLFAASRAQLVRQIILPSLAEGKIVISDRFLDSTTVYQGVARQIPPEAVSRINRFAAGPRLPDVTFLLDMDTNVAMQRLAGRTKADRMESEPLAFYEAVRRGYLGVAVAESSRFCVLNAALPPEEITRQIQAELTRRCHGLFEGIGV